NAIGGGDVAPDGGKVLGDGQPSPSDRPLEPPEIEIDPERGIQAAAECSLLQRYTAVGFKQLRMAKFAAPFGQSRRHNRCAPPTAAFEPAFASFPGETDLRSSSQGK